MDYLKLSVRLAISMVGLTILLIFAARALGILPSMLSMQQLKRESLCESIALQCSLAAQRGDTTTLEDSLAFVKSRYPEIAHLSLETDDSKFRLALGDDQLAVELQPTMVAADIPILVDNCRWGSARVVFADSDAGFLAGIGLDPALGLIAFFATMGLGVFTIYSWVLARVFLSSSATEIPDRVRDTLNSLAEGVLVLDTDHRIAFANEAFCSVSGRDEKHMRGVAADEFVQTGQPANELPWHQTSRGTGKRTTLTVQGAGSEDHVMSVRSTTLHSDDGEYFGSLATFDDLTTIEQMNARLKRLVKLLKQSRREIRQQNVELERLSKTDPLTDCLNRRAFFEQFQMLFDLSRRQHAPLACLMFDIDHFKSINDNFGHAKGDEVLKRVAKSLRQSRRSTDLVCRYGGEEFCIILSNTDLHAASDVAESMRQAIEDLEFDDLSVTASIGVSALSLGASSHDRLIEQADQALYEAKESGRNRFVSFDQLVGQNPRVGD